MLKNRIMLVLLAAFFLLSAGCISKDIHSKAEQNSDGAAIDTDGSDERTAVQAKPGMEITLGGIDNFDRNKSAEWKKGLLGNLAKFRELGATSNESYVIWRCAESEESKWDWSHYDACVEAHEETGLRWVPFLILGPAYSLPNWFYKSNEHVGYVCLEHGEESDVQSLWGPNQDNRVRTFIKEFAKQYRDRGVIESVLLGITGNYGEAIYVASGKDWTADTYGEYHTHGGMWCGDKYAIEDFREWLREKYASLERLNKAWATTHEGWDTVSPIKDAESGSVRSWLDTVDWYRDSMNQWIELWLDVATQEMPDIPVYLCTGGWSPPTHGAEFGIQSKLAAKYGAGIRITNEASYYDWNFSYTRWVSSACRFYDTFFGFEPAGVVDENGVVVRIYNATCSGARQIHYYWPNLLANEKHTRNWHQYKHLLKVREPVVKVAAWYPNRVVDVYHYHILDELKNMRAVCDYDIVDDQMIRDGALENYQNLVCISDGPYEKDILGKIDKWLKGERRLFLPQREGFTLRTVEGDTSMGETWRDHRNVVSIAGTDQKLVDFFAGLRPLLEARGVFVTNVDWTYATEFQDDSMLLLNVTGENRTVSVDGKPIELPPMSITETRRR